MPRDPLDVWAMADLTTPFAVRTVATLRIADEVSGGPLPLAELARRCGADPDPLGRVLRFLVHRGLFSEPEPGVFGPNRASRALEGDDGARAWLDLDGAVGRADLAFVELIEQVRGHHTAYPTAFGRTFWEDLAHSDRLSDSFDALMEAKTRSLAPAVASGHDWSRFARVADVGGGKGVLLAEILRTHPGLRGILLDRKGPVRNAAEHFRANGLADRTEVVAADFFEPLPVEADAVVLCDVLGDWDDDDAVRILRRCAEAAGRVVVIEVVAGPGVMKLFTELDLRMMIYVGGRLRDLDALDRVAVTAGLTVAEVNRLDNGYCIVECARR
ncbi:methyltransferase [Saccharopolyspora taberi]|uniref:Methyltransferase n=1 Tax=Saccharopolyspora taberi TaxID=60895 RepID=A0ABN3V352_9PSEU